MWEVFILVKKEEKHLVLLFYFWNLDLFISIYSMVWKYCVVFFEAIKKIKTEWPQLHSANILGGTVLRDHLNLVVAVSAAGEIEKQNSTDTVKKPS